jgi:predicted amidohydrolase
MQRPWPRVTQTQKNEKGNLSDEVYEHIIFDDLAHESLLRDPELSAKSFIVCAFGKTYHATDWKIGYCVAPPALTEEFRRVHQFLTFATCTPIQWAYADIMDDPSLYLELKTFDQQKRRNPGASRGDIMQDLKVALIQAELAWEDQRANLDRFQRRIAQVPPDVDLIVLPEMFATGFSMQAARLAQTMNGPAVAWMQARSRETGAALTGSLIIEENGRFYNRLIWAKPDGSLHTYDKKHLFRYAGEEKVYTAGRDRLTVDCCGWRIRPFICYDLRFPVWTRNLDNAFDAAIFVANWPRRRAPHWKALLKARAIENQCYVAGVNRVGVDGNGHRYSGDSGVIDPLGQWVVRKGDRETIITQIFSAAILTDYRNKFPAWMDADTDMVKGSG